MDNDLLLDVIDVTKSFRGLRALFKVSLKVYAGEVVGLIGPNGAGKTTLFNVISGFLAPDCGQVEFMERKVIGLKPHQICRLGIARTFQIVKPFSQLSTLENVAVGSYNRISSLREAEEKSWEVLRFVGMEKKALEPAKSLTTPDRKRLELARALATGPKMILLDETMSGLNPTEQKEIMGLIDKIRDAGVHFLVIEHAMRVIMGLCDRIVVIHHGECIAEGTPRAVSSNRKVIQAYLGSKYAVAED
jgi:branched-chain amino acid transport system ATP-binding protein